MSEEQELPVVARQRPAGVAFVIVLAWLAAFADLVAGVWLLIVSFDDSQFDDTLVGADVVRYWALVALLVGVLTALVASALTRGSQFARVLTIVVMALRLANAVWALVAIQYLTLWPAVVDAVLALLIIVFLTNRGASDYFRNRT